MMWDRDRGAAAVAAVPQRNTKHAFARLREYHGKTNSWGSRGALICAVGMLRNRYDKARCDSDGAAGCVRCNTMFLVRTMEELLAASADTRPEGGDALAAPFTGGAVASAQADDRRPKDD